MFEDPLWFKDAIIYEIPIRAFYDSDGDGIGDFAGLIDKLDYVQDLGVTAIWILPFYPSPQRDGGYDIADYRAVNPSLGTLADFKRLMKEAHRRGIRVITELVINHTSDQHPWFQRARRAAKGTKYRNFYVWSDDPKRYKDARIIFQDYESSNWTWDPVAQAYYWHRFYSHQPDLNFENPDVQKAVFEALDFWMALGVDGLRLDAIPYLYEREGTNCENLPETHAFLKSLRAHIDARYQNRMLLAEANQWPEDAAAYFGDGDECHMNFHFPLMPRMFMSLQLENSFPILDILAQTPKIPESTQWAIFLRNHDELTLEMVTDEDRDFMYRVYAHDPQMRVNLGIRRRLAPLLKTRAKAELMNALLFSMPGTPVLYYGDEIGMGDNVYLGDRDAVRTPMQWSPDRNAGFSKANPQKLFLPVIIDPEYHHETVNVEAQQNNSDSLLWWTKRLIALRKKHQAFGRGEIELLHPDNGKVLAFFRTFGTERILVVANLSRSPQYVQLDLSAHAGSIPVELFGRSSFPAIGELPYLLTLGPYAFYWFSIDKPRAESLDVATVAQITTKSDAQSIFHARGKDRLGPALLEWLRRRRWFRGKARALDHLSVVDAIEAGEAHIVLVQAVYAEGDPETYLVPLALVREADVATIERDTPHAIIARVRASDGESLLVDALVTEHFAADLLSLLLERGVLRGDEGLARARSTRALSELIDRSLHARAARARRREELPPRVGGAEQTNTNILFGDKLILKLFRTIEPGAHPEEEVGRFLTERARFGHVPRLLGTISYEPSSGEPRALAVLQELVPNQGDAWEFTLDALQRYYEHAWEYVEKDPAPRDRSSLLERTERRPPEIAQEAIGAYLGIARLLGERTAQLHLALASEREDAGFTPEPFSLLHQRSLYQSVRGQLGQTFHLLRKQRALMGEETAALAEQVLARRSEIDARLSEIHRDKIEAVRTRVHGDLHLGQVLYAGGDFVFIDFEGEPASSLVERRRKRSPLRDVAGMLRSFHYAAAAALRSDRVRTQDEARLASWAHVWTQWVSAAWLDAWLVASGDAPFVPRDRAVLERMLDFYLFEKGIYEVRYELNNRPEWLAIPLRGLVDLLDSEK
ncbi:MAG: maltose alpha-D-glucosyltransferase [Myxococcota bacterium]|nr:maltose alpha-D-glucosyltransferase [Myxococcota bacterium]